MSKFVLGINYWPLHSAMYAWRQFDRGEIREDMERIRDLGFDVVRFFLDWDTFQPSPTSMNANALRNFDAVMDAVASAGIKAMPTLFCGHMSGVNWLPSWSLDRNTPHGRFRTISNENESNYGIGDFYADPRLLAAQVVFAKAVAERVQDHPGLYGWDLGNEFSNLREPASPEDAAAWSTQLSETLIESSGGGWVTGGMHGEDLERDRHLRPSTISLPWEIATMHGYSVYSTFSRGRLDRNVVPFLGALQGSFTGKPLLFSEFGDPTCPANTVSPYDRVPLPGEPGFGQKKELPANAAGFACLTEEEMGSYATDVLDRLHARGAIGGFWWCWADYDPKLATLPPFDQAPHELHFGIVRSDGSLKPVAHALQAFAAQQREVKPAEAPIADEAEYYASLPKGMFELYREYCDTHE
jgi:endo-1,4-beta-mannosidase